MVFGTVWWEDFASGGLVVFLVVFGTVWWEDFASGGLVFFSGTIKISLEHKLPVLGMILNQMI